MKCAALVAVTVLGLLGCSKQGPPTDGATASGKAAPGQPAPPPPNYVAATAQNAPAQNVAGVVNPFLTEQLRVFIREKGRTPETFTELARARLDSVPRPPEGAKWVIDATSKEVKAVPAQ